MHQIRVSFPSSFDQNSNDSAGLPSFQLCDTRGTRVEARKSAVLQLLLCSTFLSHLVPSEKTP